MPKGAGRRNGQERADREGNGIEDEITDRVTGTDRKSERDRPYEIIEYDSERVRNAQWGKYLRLVCLAQGIIFWANFRSLFNFS